MRRLLRVPDAAGTCERLAHTHPLRSLALRFYGAPFTLHADDPACLDYLERVYRHFRIPEPVPQTERSLLLSPGSEPWQALVRELRPAPTASPVTGYLLLTSGFDWALELTTEALLRYYASKMLRLAVVEALDDEILTLHAASLLGPSGTGSMSTGSMGAGVLLIGEAAAGKTSTTLRLLDRGWRYGADDTSCVRRSDGMCVPFPMPLILRAELGSDRPDLAEAAQREPDISILDEPRWLVERWDAAAPEFPITHLIFLRRDDEQAGKGDDGDGPVRELSGAEATFGLLRNVMLPLGADPDTFDADGRNWLLAADLADRAVCLAADTRNYDRAFEALLAHLEPPVAVA